MNFIQSGDDDWIKKHPLSLSTGLCHEMAEWLLIAVVSRQSINFISLWAL